MIGQVPLASVLLFGVGLLVSTLQAVVISAGCFSGAALSRVVIGIYAFFAGYIIRRNHGGRLPN